MACVVNEVITNVEILITDFVWYTSIEVGVKSVGD